ncbi:hypothetical protein C8R43DRAFT_1170458 [Mycena crocata]|nr:hypothetical protein C8R43DRAFT_1170458 [Mycena crocata]
MPTYPGLPSIAIVDVPDKGQGVIAKEHIPRGTLIISETPRITMPASNLGIIQALFAMTEEDVAFFMSFSCGPSEDPIRGRLKHFTPCAGLDRFGLCETICRVNHACYYPKGGPNAAYNWNLRSLKDIGEGQEIEVSYIADITDCGDLDPPSYIRQRFGFDCTCKGCTRSVADRRASNQRLRTYTAFVSAFSSRYGRTDPLRLLKEIETQIIIICGEEGYLGEIGYRAEEAFRLCALYGDVDSAGKWDAISRDFYALYHGPASEQGLAARPQEFGTRKLKGPVILKSEKVLQCWYGAETATAVLKETPGATAGASSSASGAPNASGSVPKLSKAQKKKAKARAKKEEAKNVEGSFNQ